MAKPWQGRVREAWPPTVLSCRVVQALPQLLMVEAELDVDCAALDKVGGERGRNRKCVFQGTLINVTPTNPLYGRVKKNAG